MNIRGYTLPFQISIANSHWNDKLGNGLDGIIAPSLFTHRGVSMSLAPRFTLIRIGRAPTAHRSIHHGADAHCRRWLDCSRFLGSGLDEQRLLALSQGVHVISIHTPRTLVGRVRRTTVS